MDAIKIAHDLLRLPPEHAWLKVRNNRRLRRVAVARALVVLAHQRRYEPRLANLAADLAVAIAAECYWPDVELLCAAYLVQGDARRSRGDYAAAHHCLRRGERLLILTPGQAARAARYRISLDIDQGRYAEALDRLRPFLIEAEQRGARDDRAAGLEMLGTLTSFTGDAEAGADHVVAALKLLPPTASAARIYSTVLSLCRCLVDLGLGGANPRALAAAGRYLALLAPIDGSGEVGGIYPLKRYWLIGRLRREQGEVAQASHSLGAVVAMLQRHQLDADAHLCRLDLAAALLNGGHLAEARRVTTEAWRYFEAAELPPPAAEAVRRLGTAVSGKALSAVLLRDTVRRLERVLPRPG